MLCRYAKPTEQWELLEEGFPANAEDRLAVLLRQCDHDSSISLVGYYDRFRCVYGGGNITGSKCAELRFTRYRCRDRIAPGTMARSYEAQIFG